MFGKCRSSSPQSLAVVFPLQTFVAVPGLSDSRSPAEAHGQSIDEAPHVDVARPHRPRKAPARQLLGLFAAPAHELAEVYVEPEREDGALQSVTTYNHVLESSTA